MRRTSGGINCLIVFSRKKFKVQRYWFENFLSKENFKILDDFESSDEHYIVTRNYCQGESAEKR